MREAKLTAPSAGSGRRKRQVAGLDYAHSELCQVCSFNNSLGSHGSYQIHESHRILFSHQYHSRMVLLQQVLRCRSEAAPVFKSAICIECYRRTHQVLECGCRMSPARVVLAHRDFLFTVKHWLWCQVCWDGGSLVLCDNCPAAYHPECLGLTMKVRALPPFFCKLCRTTSDGLAAGWYGMNMNKNSLHSCGCQRLLRACTARHVLYRVVQHPPPVQLG